MGSAEGIILCPLAANAKVYSIAMEMNWISNRCFPGEGEAILSQIIFSPALAVTGVFYGLGRGAKLGVDTKEMSVMHSLQCIRKELFTFDPSVLDQEDLNHTKETRCIKKYTHVSTRKYRFMLYGDSDSLFRKKRNNKDSAIMEDNDELLDMLSQKSLLNKKSM